MKKNLSDTEAIEARANGNGNQSHLVPYTFASTGVTVLIRKLPPLLSYQLHKDFPPPKPPTQVVHLMDGGESVESNPEHPDYKIAIEEYNQEFEDKYRRMIVALAVEVEMTDEIKAQVKARRDFYRDEYNKELPGNDKLVYLMFIACAEPEEYNKLIEAVSGASRPTEETTNTAVKTFQG